MEVVLDANVLFRTLISQGDILEQEVIDKSMLSRPDVEKLAELIFKRVSPVPFAEYKPLIPKARKLLGSHEKDEDFVALCLLKNAKLWTYEKLLFDIGVAISTKDLAGLLSQQNA